MRRGQMMSAIGISNSNQSDLVQCVYITTCSFPNHTAQISVIFMHAWVSNIRISYSNIWIQLYIDYDLTYSFTPTQSSSLYNCTTNFFSCMHAHTLLVGIIHRTHTIFFFRSVSHEGTHPHTSPSPSYRAFFISHACMRNDRCSSMYVCI